MSITDFLLARIAEDEAVARAAIDPWGVDDPSDPPESNDTGEWSVAGAHDLENCIIEGVGFKIHDEGGHTPAHADHIARHDPARVLAECAAKRVIVGSCSALEGRVLDENLWNINEHDDILRALAAVYADHGEYQAEWKVGA